MSFFEVVEVSVSLFLLFFVYRQYKTIQYLKNELSHDPLTGLKIMRHFEKKCLDVMDRVERKREESLRSSPDEHTPHRLRRTHTVAFVDMDGLKWTNGHTDYGYVVGDEILKSLANILKRWKRDDDLVVRRTKGGDEFLLLFAGSTEEEAGRLLAENRRRFEKVVAKNFPGLANKVSFSFGVCEIDLGYKEKEILEAFECASKSMHSWKERRKMNRDVSALDGDISQS